MKSVRKQKGITQSITDIKSLNKTTTKLYTTMLNNIIRNGSESDQNLYQIYSNRHFKHLMVNKNKGGTTVSRKLFSSGAK